MKSIPDTVPVQTLSSFIHNNTKVDLLRADLLHPVISGNKWFKLRYYLEEAVQLCADTLVSFGGAYSNHLVALAYAAKESGMSSIGFIRGEEFEPRNPTLQDAVSYGMQLIYTDRALYRKPELIKQTENKPGWYWIPEGGHGITGAMGASALLKIHDTNLYSHIVCAVGTGTMLAGLIRAAQPHQQVIGISVLKNNSALLQQVEQLLDESDPKKNYQLLHDYHFGGYARHPPGLIAYMNDLWKREQAPTDIVYTGKMLYAVEDLLQRNYFPPDSNILVIHSGGLQGNRSLPQGALIF